MSLYEMLRSRHVIEHAWRQVRSNAYQSGSERTKKEVRRFSEEESKNLDRIKRQLRERRFLFKGDVGVPIRKEKGKGGHRPLVVSPIASRIVRRAILEVLQGADVRSIPQSKAWPGVQKVVDILQVPTSVGGVRSRGVPHGISLILNGVRSGRQFFVRSDIKSFFPSLNRSNIINFLASCIDDSEFLEICGRAIETNLMNKEELEERNLHLLFPGDSVGVAQGSALSALAGNICLKDFDRRINDQDVLCVRYIDDFIIIGSNRKKVKTAYNLAKNILSDLSMEVYDFETSKNSKKFAKGSVYDGVDFLGYRVSGLSVQPSEESCKKLISKIESTISESVKNISKSIGDSKSAGDYSYYQTLVKINRIIWGWSKSFKYTTNRQILVSLDKKIDERLFEYRKSVFSSLRSSGDAGLRRGLGIHLLTDTDRDEFPETGAAN